MKKALILLMVLVAVGCIRQTVHDSSTYLDAHSFDEVWDAAVKAVYDIDFTIESVDRESGFIGASSGTHIGQEVPPNISVMISDINGRVFVECRVLQKEQFFDLFGHGKRISRGFMTALNVNLNHARRGPMR